MLFNGHETYQDIRTKTGSSEFNLIKKKIQGQFIMR